ncbi:MAG: 4'-phosphopantetheinyl transferase family protein [Candidatus Coproplasma sp.]
MIKLTYIDVEKFSDAEFERACAALSLERLNKVQSLKFEKDRRLSAAAGYILEQALRGEGVTNPQLVYNANGKPYLKEGGVYFNLSHSGTVAVCAISDAEVGVDVQKIRPIDGGLIKKVCTEEEYAFVTADEEGVFERFCRIWTVKESVMKCLGAGLSLSTSRIRVDISDSIGAAIDGEESGLCFKEYALNGYRITACSAVNDFSPELEKVSISKSVKI